MSLLKSLTNLAKASYELAKEDKQFHKEAAITVATAPILIAKEVVDTLDNVTNATKNYESVQAKVLQRYIAKEIQDGNFTVFTKSE